MILTTVICVVGFFLYSMWESFVEKKPNLSIKDEP